MSNLLNSRSKSLNEVKFWQGTKSQHDILVKSGSIDANTIYFVLADISDGGNTIRLGNNLMDDTLHDIINSGGGGDISEEQIREIIDKIISEELSDITIKLDNLTTKVDSIDSYISVYTPNLSTVLKVYSNNSEVSADITKVEVGLEVRAELSWYLNKVDGYSMPTSVSSSEQSWNNTPIANIPIYPNKSSIIYKSYTYNQSMSPTTVTFNGTEQGYKIVNGLIKYVETAKSESVSSRLPAWGNRWYKGFTKTQDVTGGIVKAGTSTLVTNTSSALKTLNTGVITGQAKDDFYFIAYPQFAGDLSSISLKGVQDATGGFVKKTVDVINAYGVSQKYNVYVSNQSGNLSTGDFFTTK